MSYTVDDLIVQKVVEHVTNKVRESFTGARHALDLASPYLPQTELDEYIFQLNTMECAVIQARLPNAIDRSKEKLVHKLTSQLGSLE